MRNERFCTGVLELELASEPASMQRLIDETEPFLSSRISNDDVIYRVVLLATEAVTNAIEHGNKLDPQKRVYVRLEIQEVKVELIVADQGTGFDPAKTADPRAPENLLREGGRGLLFMEAMADDVRFEDDGRKVCLTFHAT